MNKPPESFLTGRLHVRRSRLDDAQPILANHAADPEVTRFLTWTAHPTLESVTQYVRTCISDWEGDVTYRYEVCLRDTDDPVGWLRLLLEKMRMLFSYVMARPLWGRGLMSEALRLLRHGKHRLGADDGEGRDEQGGHPAALAGGSKHRARAAGRVCLREGEIGPAAAAPVAPAAGAPFMLPF